MADTEVRYLVLRLSCTSRILCSISNQSTPLAIIVLMEDVAEEVAVVELPENGFLDVGRKRFRPLGLISVRAMSSATMPELREPDGQVGWEQAAGRLHQPVGQVGRQKAEPFSDAVHTAFQRKQPREDA